MKGIKKILKKERKLGMVRICSFANFDFQSIEVACPWVFLSPSCLFPKYYDEYRLYKSPIMTIIRNEIFVKHI